MEKLKEKSKMFYQKFMGTVRKNDGFGMNEALGMAVGLILAAFIIIPQLRQFATDVMSGLDTWWTSISGTIFPSS